MIKRRTFTFYFLKLKRQSSIKTHTFMRYYILYYNSPQRPRIKHLIK